MGDQKKFVTKMELFKTQVALREDFSDKIRNVDDKVDQLKDIVLPLVESSRQTAENTKRIAEVMDGFTKEQRNTNGKIWSKLNQHEVELTEVGLLTKTQVELKKSNATIIVAIIGVLSVVVSGVFALAPLIFGG